MSKPSFHLAFPVNDIDATRAFYEGLLGCGIGRIDAEGTWIDFDFFGHQITAHKVGREVQEKGNQVDHDQVPIPHFGLVLEWDDWHALRDRLVGAGVEFVIEPKIRFQGQVAEQATMFLRDPSGNALEFKSFQDMRRVFASDA